MYISHVIYLFILLDICIAVPFWLLSTLLLSVLLGLYLKVK